LKVEDENHYEPEHDLEKDADNIAVKPQEEQEIGDAVKDERVDDDQNGTRDEEGKLLLLVLIK